MVDIFLGKHFSHIGSARRIAYHCGASANQSNRLISSHLQALHKSQRHEMSRSQTIRDTVKADIKCCFTVVNHVADFFFVGNLCNKASFF